jgi:DNA-binding beta-propeller fold protein YncE
MRAVSQLLKLRDGVAFSPEMSRACARAFVMRVAPITFLILAGVGSSLAAPGDIYVADATANAILEFSPSGSATTFATLNDPYNITFGPDGYLYVLQPQNSQVARISPIGQVTSFAPVFNPQSLAFDRNGNLFVGSLQSAQNASSIIEISPLGVENVFATGLNSVSGLAFDNSGNLFTADPRDGTIVKLLPDGSQSVFASVGGGGEPAALTIDNGGTLWAYEDRFLNYFYKISPSASVSTFNAANAGFADQLAFDASGNLFEVDSTDGKVLKFNTTTGAETTFATGLNLPVGIAVQPVPELNTMTSLLIGAVLFGFLFSLPAFRLHLRNGPTSTCDERK